LRGNGILWSTALFLGVAWAIRGHFGHEWGAAWAGAIGAMALIVGSGRKDWLAQLPYLGAVGALGWSVGGMMSYGIVIGYCRGDDFGNVFYGFLMLAIIGALYGVMGGGFLALALETTKEKKPDWARLLTEMVAGAMLIWGISIYQLEWFMTPPRSELWAACLGAALAMLWHMKRHGFHKAYRVALYTACGAGFGFSFGNFIQGLGHAADIAYNWWNVMEFILGFSGGLAMAYAVITTEWKETRQPPAVTQNLSLAFLFVGIPLTNYLASYTDKRLVNVAQSLGLADPAGYASSLLIMGAVLLVVCAAVAIVFWISRTRYQQMTVARGLLLSTAGAYLILGMFLKGYFVKMPSINNSVSAYLPLFLLGYYFISRNTFPPFSREESKRRDPLPYVVAIVAVVILVIALVSLWVNPPLENVNRRY